MSHAQARDVCTDLIEASCKSNLGKETASEVSNVRYGSAEKDCGVVAKGIDSSSWQRTWEKLCKPETLVIVGPGSIRVSIKAMYRYHINRICLLLRIIARVVQPMEAVAIT